MNMIAIEDICEKGKFSVQTLHRLRRAGVFPPPRLQLSRKLIRWNEDEVNAFFRGEWVPESK